MASRRAGTFDSAFRPAMLSTALRQISTLCYGCVGLPFFRVRRSFPFEYLVSEGKKLLLLRRELSRQGELQTTLRSTCTLTPLAEL